MTKKNTVGKGAPDDYLQIEDYDAIVDGEFVTTCLKPYLNDLYRDLLMRSNQSQNIDKVTFVEYTKLPGIINDRLHTMFSEAYNKQLKTNQDGSMSPISRMQSQLSKKDMEERKQGQYVTQESFIRNFTQIFIGDLEGKMRFTFNMYDFDDDGFITPEDVRIMMSYMPFDRNIRI